MFLPYSQSFSIERNFLDYCQDEVLKQDPLVVELIERYTYNDDKEVSCDTYWERLQAEFGISIGGWGSNAVHFNNLEPLRGLANLKSININVTGQIDLAPLKGLGKLEYFKLISHPEEQCEINSIAFLKDLSKLRDVFIKSCNINNGVSDLLNNQNVGRVSFSEMTISKDELNKSISNNIYEFNLTEIDFTSTGDILKQAEMPELYYLEIIESHGFTGVKNLYKFKKLDRLDITDNDLTNLTFLDKVYSIIKLNVARNKRLKDLSPLEDLVKNGSLREINAKLTLYCFENSHPSSFLGAKIGCVGRSDDDDND